MLEMAPNAKTTYDLSASLLPDHPLNGYLINSPMLPGPKFDDGGELTLFIKHKSPGTS
jgi:hypothetical protein